MCRVAAGGGGAAGLDLIGTLVALDGRLGRRLLGELLVAHLGARGRGSCGVSSRRRCLRGGGFGGFNVAVLVGVMMGFFRTSASKGCGR